MLEPQPGKTPTPTAVVVTAGIIAALLSTLVSALLIASLAGSSAVSGGFPSVWNLAKTTALLCPITAVSCGSYGLFSGVLGCLVLYFRRRRFRSLRRFLVESGTVGFALGFLFPFFDRFFNGPLSDSPMEIIFSAPVGLLCALICAQLLQNRFVSKAAEPLIFLK